MTSPGSFPTILLGFMLNKIPHSRGTGKLNRHQQLAAHDGSRGWPGLWRPSLCSPTIPSLILPLSYQPSQCGCTVRCIGHSGCGQNGSWIPCKRGVPGIFSKPQEIPRHWQSLNSAVEKNLSIAVKTAVEDVLTSGEFCNPRRRIAHLLTMYGFIIFIITTAILISSATDPGGWALLFFALFVISSTVLFGTVLSVEVRPHVLQTRGGFSAACGGGGWVAG